MMEEEESFGNQEEQIQLNEPEKEEKNADEVFEEEVSRLEELAKSLDTAMPVRSLPKQEYLQATVVPLLIEGISWIIKERPEDPVENLAMFLIKNNPMTPELHRTLDASDFE